MVDKEGRSDLKIHFVDTIEKIRYKTFTFDNEWTVGECISRIKQKQKLQDSESVSSHGLFVGSDEKNGGGVWLSPNARLKDCRVSFDTRIEFKNQKQAIEFTDLSGDVSKKILVDDTSLVKDVIRLVAGRYGIADDVEFSLEIISKDDPSSRYWADPSQTLREQGLSARHYVVFRKKYHVTDASVSEDDSKLLHLLCVEALHAIVKSLIPVTQEQAVTFAAHQVQIKYGHYDPLLHVAGFLQDNLHEVLPKKYTSIKFIEELIYEQHRRLKAMNKIQTEHKFVQMALLLPLYGASLWISKEKTADSPTDIIIGCNAESLLFVHHESKEIMSHYPLSQLQVFSSDANLVSVQTTRRREFWLETQDDASLFMDMVSGYTRFIKARRKDLYSAKQSTPKSPKIMASSPRAGSMRYRMVSMNTPSIKRQPKTADAGLRKTFSVDRLLDVPENGGGSL